MLQVGAELFAVEFNPPSVEKVRDALYLHNRKVEGGLS